MSESYYVRPHQVPALIDLVDGAQDVVDLESQYGPDIVRYLSSVLTQLADFPDDQVIFVSRKSSSICALDCKKRNMTANPLCDTTRSETLLYEQNSMEEMGLKERLITGYSINELRALVAKNRIRKIAEIL